MIHDLPEKDSKIITESAKPKLLKRGEILFKAHCSRSVVWLISGKAKIFQRHLVVSDRRCISIRMVT
jgi:hypothetical protein